VLTKTVPASLLWSDDLDANEKPQEPPGSDVGGRKGIQAATYGYANLP
jgi:hypothetical protein